MADPCPNLEKDDDGNYIDTITGVSIPNNRLISLTYPNGKSFCYDALALVEWFVKQNQDDGDFWGPARFPVDQWPEVKDPLGTGYIVPKSEMDKAIEIVKNSIEINFAAQIRNQNNESINPSRSGSLKELLRNCYNFIKEIRCKGIAIYIDPEFPDVELTDSLRKFLFPQGYPNINFVAGGVGVIAEGGGIDEVKNFFMAVLIYVNYTELIDEALASGWKLESDILDKLYYIIVEQGSLFNYENRGLNKSIESELPGSGDWIEALNHLAINHKSFIESNISGIIGIFGEFVKKVDKQGSYYELLKEFIFGKVSYSEDMLREIIDAEISLRFENPKVYAEYKMFIKNFFDRGIFFSPLKIAMDIIDIMKLAGPGNLEFLRYLKEMVALGLPESAIEEATSYLNGQLQEGELQVDGHNFTLNLELVLAIEKAFPNLIWDIDPELNNSEIGIILNYLINKGSYEMSEGFLNIIMQYGDDLSFDLAVKYGAKFTDEDVDKVLKFNNLPILKKLIESGKKMTIEKAELAVSEGASDEIISYMAELGFETVAEDEGSQELGDEYEQKSSYSED